MMSFKLTFKGKEIIWEAIAKGPVRQNEILD